MITSDIQRSPWAVRAVSIALVMAAGAGLIACKSKPPKPPPPPPPVILTLSLSASADVNPDSKNEPSPVVVRLYQLKDDAAFKDADIYALFDTEQATLGAALAAREEYELAPLEHRSLSIRPPPEVRFFGVVAAYRDIRNAQWRAELGVPDKSKTIVINVAHTSVSLSMY